MGWLNKKFDEIAARPGKRAVWVEAQLTVLAVLCMFRNIFCDMTDGLWGDILGLLKALLIGVFLVTAVTTGAIYAPAFAVVALWFLARD